MSDYPMRINKYMAQQKICSRREADRLVKAGFVTLNGVTAELGDKVNEGNTVKVQKGSMYKRIYLAFNKPRGIITHSPDASRGEQSIMDIIDFPHRIFPIGRLDKDSHGLIILTNDGLVTKRLLEPDEGREKEYIVHVDKPITSKILKVLSAGVKLDDGYTTQPCVTKRLDNVSFRMILTEGKKRQIRRMCEAVGYNVIDLQRTRIVNIKLDDILEGHYRNIEGPQLEIFLKALDLEKNPV